RPAVEGGQAPRALAHRREAAEPDELRRVVKVAEGADDGHAGRLLRLDEVGLEQVDEDVPLPRDEAVLPQLDDRRRAHVETVPAAWLYEKIHGHRNRRGQMVDAGAARGRDAAGGAGADAARGDLERRPARGRAAAGLAHSGGRA